MNYMDFYKQAKERSDKQILEDAAKPIPADASKYELKQQMTDWQRVKDNNEHREANQNMGMHIAGKAAQGVTLGIGGLANRYTKATTGGSISDSASDYGDYAGVKGERWLRAAGSGTELASSLPTVAVAMQGAAAIPQARALGAGATKLQKLLHKGRSIALKAPKTKLGRTRIKTIGDAAQNTADTIDLGGRSQLGGNIGNALTAGRFASSIAQKGYKGWLKSQGANAALFGIRKGNEYLFNKQDKDSEPIVMAER